jgi:hypothetical protein
VGVWIGEVTLTGVGERVTPPRIPRRSAKGGRWILSALSVGETLLKFGDCGGRGREGGLGSTREIWEKGSKVVSRETLGVTGVGFIVLGAVKDLFWEGETAGEEGGRLNEAR